MKINEIINSNNITNDILDDLMDLLMVYRQAGSNEVSMTGPSGVISYLNNRGHDVDIESIMNLDISNIPKLSYVVTRVDPKKITLKPSMNTNQVSKDELDKSKEKVAKGAAKGAEKIVKSGGRV